MTLREQVFRAMRTGDDSRAGRRWRALHFCALAVGLVSAVLSSASDLPERVELICLVTLHLVSVAFLLEYLVRLWAAPEDRTVVVANENAARLRWAVSWNGTVGLLAALPTFMVVSGYAAHGAEAASAFCLLWILKLGTHAPAAAVLMRVLSNERNTLAAIAVIFLSVLVSSATLAHIFERDGQPAAFGTIGASLWWSITTLTTTGYGDVVPLTTAGRMVGALVMVSGIAVLALMTGVLATGFAEEEKRREFLRVWEQVSRVPIFTRLGTITLSEIVGRLRTRHYPARVTVVRRGDPGDSMFFITSGAVEVRLDDRRIPLHAGGFFGEMSLLDRRSRNASVATTEPTTLLVLYASDFYQIAGHNPALIQAVEEEAARRRAENRAASPHLTP